MKNVLLFLIVVSLTNFAQAQNKPSSRVQKINFEETDVDGKVRQPDGSYVVQKRGVEFIPMYKLKEGFDEQVEDSLEFLK